MPANNRDINAYESPDPCCTENEVLYEQLVAYDNHLCADVSSAPTLVIAFCLGSVVGRLIKRVI